LAHWRNPVFPARRGESRYTSNGHNVRSCVHRGDAEGAEKTQRSFIENFSDSLRSLCALGVSAVNTRAHIMTVQSIGAGRIIWRHS